MEYLTLDKIDAYVVSYSLGNAIWNIVSKWENFERWTIGVQITKSSDSIAANIAEGFGRYHKKDKIRFYRYSFGSLEETKHWVKIARDRSLISSAEAVKLTVEMEQLPKMIHQLIQYTNQKLRF